jgi:hypothetical protein
MTKFVTSVHILLIEDLIIYIYYIVGFILFGHGRDLFEDV